MQNINYKIVSIVLAGILLVTYSWHWQEIFGHQSNMDMSNMQMSGKKTSHMMQMPDGSMMEMNNSDMNMGSMKMDNSMMDMTMSDMSKMMDKPVSEMKMDMFLSMDPAVM